MTSRPGNAALQRLPLHAQGITEVYRITRNDGAVLRITTHDRPISFDGETYSPAILQASSADRREAALRPGNQEVYGTIDGSTILASDLLTYAYRGARIDQVLVDFARPWITFGHSVRWIRNIAREGDRWIAELEGRTAKLLRPQAQRFGGKWQKECPYELGGEFCGADISQWTYLAQVRAVTGTRSRVEFWGNNFPNVNPDTGSAYVDQFYRDGSVEWLYDNGTSGVSWDALTTTSLTDSSESWTADEFVGDYVIVLDASGIAEAALITANTATTLTFEALSSAPGSGVYSIAAVSPLAGVVSPIVSHLHADRDIELLIPTPKDIGVGYWAIVRPGCDGLLTTCRDKFDNEENHGGDQYAPSGQEIIEPPEDN